MPLFGVSVNPLAADLPGVVEAAQAADRHGLDLVGVQDHPYQAAFADTMALIAALMPVTRRVRIFPDVANLPLRPAAMLAKASATIDLLSGGRFELGLGSGAVLAAVRAYGGPDLTPPAAVSAFAEGVEVIRAVWSGERSLRAGDRHHRLQGAHGGPVPAHDIGIWVGAVGPRMLALTGRLGDGWAAPIPRYLPFEDLPAAQRRIDEAAIAAGRSPRDILRLQQIPGAIHAHRDEGPARGDAPLVGTAQRWIEQLTHAALEGRWDGFILWPTEPGTRQIRIFAEEVAPAVREAVAAERAR